MRVKLFEYLIILQKKISKRRVIDPFINVVFIICSVLLTNSNEVSFFLFRRSHQCAIIHFPFSSLNWRRVEAQEELTSHQDLYQMFVFQLNCEKPSISNPDQLLVSVPLSPSLNITPKTKQTPSSKDQLELGLTIKYYWPVTLQYTIHLPFFTQILLTRMTQNGLKLIITHHPPLKHLLHFLGASLINNKWIT